MSGHGDSIRERRAREIRFGDGWEEDKATTVTVPTLGLLAALVLDVEAAARFVEKVVQGRLPLDYLKWNGRTDVNVILPTDDVY